MPVKGFEKYTHNLRAGEVKNLPKLLDFLNAASAEIPISANDIKLYFAHKGFGTDGARIRKMINFIRTEIDPKGKVLVAGARGYFWTADARRIIEYSESLRNRYNEIRRVMYHIVKVLETVEHETKDPIEKKLAAEEKNAIEKDIQGKLFD